MTSPTSRQKTGARMGHIPPGFPWPRYLNALAGAWLLVSIYLWPHAESARANTWTIGLMMALAALTAVHTPAVRWCNTALALWLGLSTLSMSNIAPATFYNNLLVALISFVLSLMPNTKDAGGSR
jgi:hypothetical protein